MANKRLREDLDDTNRHYRELIAVSKEGLKRKRRTQSQFEELNQKIQNLTQQNERLSKKIEYLNAEQKITKRKSHALEGIALLAEATKNLSRILVIGVK